ncbi:Protein of unknown function [Pyronema omphalodes CBS 100304]|uniref:Uncharacterized protein n=1 Tax=Pyronema omphalodes (strain CBS 100304) TaxID=1076935 RepID=U4KY64_PYROM|nr:Protein of unknown function [Pyronema omphalodes CBS 100304]
MIYGQLQEKLKLFFGKEECEKIVHLW